MKVVNAEEFEQLLTKDKLVVVFGATWCKPCQAVEMTVSQIEDQFDFDFVKIDVDASTPVAQKYGVRGVPTIIMFKDGKPAGDVLVGAQPGSKLKDAIRACFG